MPLLASELKAAYILRVRSVILYRGETCSVKVEDGIRLEE